MLLVLDLRVLYISITQARILLIQLQQSVYHYSRRSPGRAKGPTGCGHSKLARVCAYWVAADWCVVCKSDGSTSRNSTTIFFAKASKAEIWTRVHRRYLTSFAGLHFENEPGLTELDAAEGRRNRRRCVSKRGQWRKHYSDVIGQAKNRFCKTRQDLADKRPMLASIATKE